MNKVKEGYKMTELGEIPEKWEIYSLNEMIDNKIIVGHLDGNHGGLYPKSDEFVNEGVPYIGANCIKDSKIDFTNAKYLTYERAKQFKKGVAKNNDVLFAHNATVGPVALLDTKLDFVILSTTLTYYRCNTNTVNPKYLMYYMQTPIFVNQYSKTMGQTTRNQVPITMQRELKHIIPPKSVQDKITLILSAVDEKIENTDNLIEKTKELKKGLMQRLFTKGIGHDRFKDTDIGRIPEEWGVRRLGDIAKYINGKAFKPSDWSEEGVRIVRIQNLNGSEEFNYCNKQVEDRYYIENNELLFSWSGSRGTSFGPFLWRGNKAVLNQHIFKVELNEELDKNYCYFALKKITKDIEENAHGSAGLVHITKGELEKFKIPIPKEVEQKQIALILSSVDEKIKQYESKKEKLQELKKGLMQKLLKGKIRVKV